MAGETFALQGTKQATYVFEDRDKNTSDFTIYAPDAVLLESMNTFAPGAGATNLAAVSDATIRRIVLTQVYENTTFVVPPESSDIERKLVLPLRASDRTISTFAIPSVKNTLVIDGTNTINTTDPLVVTLLGMFLDAGILDATGLANYRGIKLTELRKAPYKRHRDNPNG